MHGHNLGAGSKVELVGNPTVTLTVTVILTSIVTLTLTPTLILNLITATVTVIVTVTLTLTLTLVASGLDCFGASCSPESSYGLGVRVRV